jgi:thiol-disulfide isomerase/thioredoxin
MRKWFALAGSIAVVVVIAIGIAQSDGGESSKSVALVTPDQASAKLRGSPPRLTLIHAQSSEVLEGGTSAFRKRVRDLRGIPVVVNVWGAWCGPCRTEMPYFNRASANFGKRVAFLGVDTEDNTDEAEAFLEKIPVYYPSYDDKNSAISNSFGVAGVPSTIFYDRRGREFAHQGVYRSEQDLLNDIKRYALSG